MREVRPGEQVREQYATACPVGWESRSWGGSAELLDAREADLELVPQLLAYP